MEFFARLRAKNCINIRFCAFGRAITVAAVQTFFGQPLSVIDLPKA
jgi:hypothetical protein